LELVEVAEYIVKQYVRSKDVVFVGHSLGGAAAMLLGLKFPFARVVAYNAVAAATNPMLHGPGEKAIHYHVVGDLISSHMSPSAARIIRVKLPWKFGHEICHDAKNLVYACPWKYYDRDKHQQEWETFCYKHWWFRLIIWFLGIFKYSSSSKPAEIPR
jgi:pimeloyl-ACP methyl ester carboxylesterase